MLLLTFLKVMLQSQTAFLNVDVIESTDFVKVPPSSATQISTLTPHYAINAIDGDLETYTHTLNDVKLWLRIQLYKNISVHRVVIFNRLSSQDRYPYLFKLKGQVPVSN